MSLVRLFSLIGSLCFLCSAVYADEVELALQEAMKDIDMDSVQIEIRTIASPDIRDIHENIVELKQQVSDLDQAVSDLNAEVRDNEIFVELSAELLFDFDKFDVKPEAKEALTKLAKIIAEKADGTVTIKGHTDAKGTESYNKDLSLKRAIAIRIWLIQKGGVKPKFSVEGLGETSPVAPNLSEDGQDNPEGRAKNRRVEVFIETRSKAG